MLARLLISCFSSPWRVKFLCQFGRLKIIRTTARSLWACYQYENSSSVAWNASFGGEPCFPHGMKGVFVSGEARVGKNCVIFQQVTIGSVMMPGAKALGGPILGNDVYIGAGAKIVGAVRIGDNVRIGANAVVHMDIGDNCVVVAGEQKVMQKEGVLDNRFYSYREGQWEYFSDGEYLRVEDGAVVSTLNAGRRDSFLR